MKNLKKLGVILNKKEQQSINGGKARACGPCRRDDHCGNCNITSYFHQDYRCVNNTCVAQ